MTQSNSTTAPDVKADAALSKATADSADAVSPVPTESQADISPPADASASVNESTDMCLYPNLRTHREQRGLSQVRLAALANVGKDLISSAERKNSHRRMKLFAVIHALNEHPRTKSYGQIDPDKELVRAS